MDSSNDSSAGTKFLSQEWRGLIKKQLAPAILVAIIFFIYVFLKNEMRFDKLHIFLFGSIAFAIVIFLILMAFNIAPSFYFYKKRINQGYEQLITEKVKAEGLHKLVKTAWFMNKKNFEEIK